MLPTEGMLRTNFLNGMKFNPEQIRLNDRFYDERNSILSIGGVGSGILAGFMDSLMPEIEGDLLIIKSGSAIDRDGNLIFVDKASSPILDGLSNRELEDKKTLYIYIKYDEKLEDLRDSRDDSGLKLHYKKVSSYKIILRDKDYTDKTLIEIGRVFIDQSKGEEITMPINPFEPKENEIDIRFAPKIISANSVLDYDEKLLISNIIRKYANFLNEISFRKKLFSASTTASLAYKILSDIRTFDIGTWQLYDMFYDLLDITLKIQDEEPKVVNSAFGKNITRLQDIFSFKESYKVDYYTPYVNTEDSFFYKVLLHFSNATVFDGDWENIFGSEESKEKKKQKEYVIIGTSDECDIVVDGEDIVEQHARLWFYKGGFLIEDLMSSSGIYINSERLEIGVKKFVTPRDYVVLGKVGTLLNLNDPIIQELRE